MSRSGLTRISAKGLNSCAETGRCLDLGAQFPRIILGNFRRGFRKQMTDGPSFMQEAIQVWEGEGGGLRQSSEGRVAPRFAFGRGGPAAAEKKMIGTANQVDWAERIKRQVSAEFDRVENALQSAMSGQPEPKRGKTLTAIAILEDKRAEVMAQDQAGYFINEWQELRDQVRQMITQDSRYQAIRANRAAE